MIATTRITTDQHHPRDHKTKTHHAFGHPPRTITTQTTPATVHLCGTTTATTTTATTTSATTA